MGFDLASHKLQSSQAETIPLDHHGKLTKQSVFKTTNLLDKVFLRRYPVDLPNGVSPNGISPNGVSPKTQMRGFAESPVPRMTFYSTKFNLT
jgi:hypothetical protein